MSNVSFEEGILINTYSLIRGSNQSEISMWRGKRVFFSSTFSKVPTTEQHAIMLDSSCVGTAERCRVLLRLKPLQDDESSPIVVEGNTIRVKRETKECADESSTNFGFDHIFGPETSQEELFESVLADSIEPVLNGFNATFLAFGQTGSGKTYSMFGDGGSFDKRGIIPRALEEIFKRISEDASGGVYVVKAAMIEIYKEELKDLLHANEGKLRLRESVFDGVWVEGLHWVFVASAQAVLALLMAGMESRSIGATQMNEKSSRSHCIFLLRVEYQKSDGIVQRGTLHFADLAGLERVDRTGAQGQTLEEAKKINLSLSALGNCIHALSQPGRIHIPFRDSKLTFLLKNSLGGNAKTTLLIAASARWKDIDESIGAFKFGARARAMKNMVKINQKLSAEELERLFNKLKQEHDSLQKYCESLEGKLAAMGEAQGKENCGSECKAIQAPNRKSKKGNALAPSERHNIQTQNENIEDTTISDTSFFMSPMPAKQVEEPHSVSSICNRWRRATIDVNGTYPSPLKNLDPIKLLHRITELESANVDMQIEIESLIMQQESSSQGVAGVVRTSLPRTQEPPDLGSTAHKSPPPCLSQHSRVSMESQQCAPPTQSLLETPTLERNSSASSASAYAEIHQSARLITMDSANSPHCQLASPQSMSAQKSTLTLDAETNPRTPVTLADAALQTSMCRESPHPELKLPLASTQSSQTSPLPCSDVDHADRSSLSSSFESIRIDGTVPASASDNSVVMHGELYKKRRWLSGFRKVEMWLSESSILFNSTNDGIRKELQLCFASSVDSIGKREAKGGVFEFVIHFKGKQYVFATSTREDRTNWIEKISTRLSK